MTSTTTPSAQILIHLNTTGTSTVSQLSSATGVKRIDVQSHLKALTVDGLVENVGGSVYRIKPSVVARLNAKVEAPAEPVAAAKVEAPKVEAPAPAAVKPEQTRNRKSPKRDAVLNAIVAAGGVANVKTLTAATGFKDTTVIDAAFKLRRDGDIVSPAIGFYAIPGAEIPEGTLKAKRATRPKGKRPYGRVASKIFAALEGEGGVATGQRLAEITGIRHKSVTDCLYHLRNGGWVVKLSRNEYALQGISEAKTAPEAPVAAPEPAPVAEAPTPVVKEEEILNVPEASERETPAEQSTEDLVADLVALAAPDGLPATVKASKALVKFISAAERLVAAARP